MFCDNFGKQKNLKRYFDTTILETFEEIWRSREI